MLHILNLYSGICQLFLNKTKKKKTTSFSFPCLSLYNFTGSSFLYNFCSCLFCYSLPLWTPGNLRRRFFLWWTTVHQPLYPTIYFFQKIKSMFLYLGSNVQIHVFQDWVVVTNASESSEVGDSWLSYQPVESEAWQCHVRLQKGDFFFLFIMKIFKHTRKQ